MIDNEGYRPNVGIVICNHQNQVLWAKRLSRTSWQFPQGGINDGENLETAMYRELYEEVGLTRDDVEVLWVTKGWLKYKLPKNLIRTESKPLCIGQKQRWFLLRLKTQESNINLNATPLPEFDDYRWVSFWYPVRQIIYFKQDVYRRAMKEFAHILMQMPEPEPKAVVEQELNKTLTKKQRKKAAKKKGFLAKSSKIKNKRRGVSGRNYC